MSFRSLGTHRSSNCKIKLTIPELWRRGLNWDSKIPDNLLREWNIWTENVIKLSLVNLPRWINFSSNSEVAELHIFAEDSNMACGTTGHIKTVHQISLNIMQFSYWETNLQSCS